MKDVLAASTSRRLLLVAGLVVVISGVLVTSYFLMPPPPSHSECGSALYSSTGAVIPSAPPSLLKLQPSIQSSTTMRNRIITAVVVFIIVAILAAIVVFLVYYYTQPLIMTKQDVEVINTGVDEQDEEERSASVDWRWKWFAGSVVGSVTIFGVIAAFLSKNNSNKNPQRIPKTPSEKYSKVDKGVLKRSEELRRSRAIIVESVPFVQSASERPHQPTRNDGSPLSRSLEPDYDDADSYSNFKVIFGNTEKLRKSTEQVPTFPPYHPKNTINTTPNPKTKTKQADQSGQLQLDTEKQQVVSLERDLKRKRRARKESRNAVAEVDELGKQNRDAIEGIVRKFKEGSKQ